MFVVAGGHAVGELLDELIGGEGRLPVFEDAVELLLVGIGGGEEDVRGGVDGGRGGGFGAEDAWVEAEDVVMGGGFADELSDIDVGRLGGLGGNGGGDCADGGFRFVFAVLFEIGDEFVEIFAVGDADWMLGIVKVERFHAADGGFGGIVVVEGGFLGGNCRKLQISRDTLTDASLSDPLCTELSLFVRNLYLLNAS